MSWNNKKLGTEFERRVVEVLSAWGAWVHFITPDVRGAQPFDIIAVKDNIAVAVECKTLSTDKRYFTVNRLEDNQRMAFEKWKACGNRHAVIAVEYGDKIIFIPYDDLVKEKRIDMRKDYEEFGNSK